MTILAVNGQSKMNDMWALQGNAVAMNRNRLTIQKKEAIIKAEKDKAGNGLPQVVAQTTAQLAIRAVVFVLSYFLFFHV